MIVHDDKNYEANLHQNYLSINVIESEYIAMRYMDHKRRYIIFVVPSVTLFGITKNFTQYLISANNFTF
jgi:hypothetical protein